MEHVHREGESMDTSIVPDFPAIDTVAEWHCAPQDDTHLKHNGKIHARSGIPKSRMRLLHFVNVFGGYDGSEYCRDAMLSLVLLMAKSSNPDADRLARLTGTTRAAFSEGYGSSGEASAQELTMARHAG
jgi:hypothetical protein